MATDRWSDKRLSQLADLIERLATQVQQLHGQVGQVSQQVEQTCLRVDQLTATIRSSNASSNASPAVSGATPDVFASVDTARTISNDLMRLEARLEQLDRRVKGLEHPPVAAPLLQPAVVAHTDDDEIEDEPDEVLWDFLDPAERGR